MNKDEIASVFDIITEALNKVKLTLTADNKEIKAEESQPEVASVAIDLLATRLAYSYTTKHPEYKIESQFKNLKDMIACDKITYIIAWLRKGNTSGIEQFLTMKTADQRILLEKALSLKENKIKEIFTERFSCK